MSAHNFVSMELRVLGSDGVACCEQFLREHSDTSMFLRANARKAGLVYAGERYQATYLGAFVGDRLVGVVAHAWNGILLVQAPDEVEVVARACVAASGRRVTGFSGPLTQVRRAREALGLAEAAATLDADEALYALDLAELIVPAALVDGRVVCRPPRPEEISVLHAWRHAYSLETLGAEDSEVGRRRAAEDIDAQVADGVVWVAVADGAPVSLATFNAALPDIVQLGGIYTPPRLRGQGHARAAVAGSLQAARERGATRAVLFTNNPHAERSYRAIGFRRTGEFGLILLA